MIRRDAGHDFQLITQVDHAAVAAQLAMHVGNSRFNKPSPNAIEATRMHDDGWPLHDDEPTLNDRGFPLDVFEIQREIGLKVWAASAERAQQANRYAGLLVSLHSLSLSIFATTSTSQKTEKFDVKSLHAQFEINRFQHREVERQEQLRQQLGFATDSPLKHGLAQANASALDDQLRFDFYLLQAMDLLSLSLCCSALPQERSGDLLRHPTASAMQLRITKSLDATVHVSPWPFDVKRIDVTVPSRRVSGRRFATVDEFRSEFQQAEVESVNLAIAM